MKELFKKVVKLESQNVSALPVKKIEAGSKVQWRGRKGGA